MNTKLNECDAAVLYIFGQSNAHAHEQRLENDELVRYGLKHVFTLDNRIDRSLDNKNVTWRQYNSEFNNLGEVQNGTATLAHYTALEWERRIEGGQRLPDLYIVQISAGGQGIINDMWTPDMDKTISDDRKAPVPLYHLAMHIDELVYDDLKKRFKNPISIGLHWIGSESDALEKASKKSDFRRRYDFFFDTIISSLGFECPIYLYRTVCKNCLECRNGLENVNNIFDEYTRIYKNCSIVSASASPFWDENADDLGIFADGIHYRAYVQKWFSDKLFDNLGI